MSKKKTKKKTELRRYLDFTEMTYREAAKRTGLTHQTIFLHAKGKLPIGAASALKYNKAFGISLEKLITDRVMVEVKNEKR